jgi:hypothetical protein
MELGTPGTIQGTRKEQSHAKARRPQRKPLTLPSPTRGEEIEVLWLTHALAPWLQEWEQSRGRRRARTSAEEEPTTKKVTNTRNK